MEKLHLSNMNVLSLAHRAAAHLHAEAGGARYITLFPVPRGGVPAAYAIASAWNKTVDGEAHVEDLTAYTGARGQFIVDDVVDSGHTALAKLSGSAREQPAIVALTAKRAGVTLLEKHNIRTLAGHVYEGTPWIIFPWETDSRTGEDTGGTDIVRRMLQYIGEKPDREGLLKTPARVVKAWGEWFSGYSKDPRNVLGTVFKDGGDAYNELVLVANIPVYSHCEHHLAPIIGRAHVGYIPDGKIVGLSKINRVVDMFARRLQVQERMTTDIADAINGVLAPKGVGVIVRARHMCMESRGVQHTTSTTTTSALRGVLFEHGPARAEFLRLCSDAENA